MSLVVKQKIANELVKAKIVRKLKKRQKRFILLGTPLHGNLGDQAISIAEHKYLQKEFEDRSTIEIPRYYFEMFEKQLKKYIKESDVILIHGGGFLGTLWIAEEYFVRKIIQQYPNNPIVIFPQTVFYAKDENARLELKRSEEIYNKHEKLYICAREKFSFEFMKEHYNQCKIIFVPDIVLYLSNKLKLDEKTREGILFCFRKDKEKQIDDKTINLLNEIAKGTGEKITNTDTVVNYNVYMKNREEEVGKLWNEFTESKLVVTDRLHGMIFSAITGTPCIVFRNSNYKVEGVYEWIKDLDYINFVNDIEEFRVVFQAVYNKRSRVKIELEEKFDPLTSVLKSFFKLLIII